MSGRQHQRRQNSVGREVSTLGSTSGSVFPDPHLVAAIVDRLTLNAHILETGTQSYRLYTRSQGDLWPETDSGHLQVGVTDDGSVDGRRGWSACAMQGAVGLAGRRHSLRRSPSPPESPGHARGLAGCSPICWPDSERGGAEEWTQPYLPEA